MAKNALMKRSAASVAELPIWPEKIQGGRLVAMLQQYVESLRDESAHGNRELFLDDVFVVYLLAFFNPTLRTLRTLEDFSVAKQAQRHLSIRRICRSTLSDFHRIADHRRDADVCTPKGGRANICSVCLVWRRKAVRRWRRSCRFCVSVSVNAPLPAQVPRVVARKNKPRSEKPDCVMQSRPRRCMR
jgi:hypothetical protein